MAVKIFSLSDELFDDGTLKAQTLEERIHQCKNFDSCARVLNLLITIKDFEKINLAKLAKQAFMDYDKFMLCIDELEQVGVLMVAKSKAGDVFG